MSRNGYTGVVFHGNDLARKTSRTASMDSEEERRGLDENRLTPSHSAPIRTLPQSVEADYNPLHLFAVMRAHDLRLASPLIPGSDRSSMYTPGPVQTTDEGFLYGRLVNYVEIQGADCRFAGRGSPPLLSERCQPQ